MDKKYTITKKESYSIDYDKHGSPEYTFEGGEDMKVSDGYHTMDELYEHRIALWIAICRMEAQTYGGLPPANGVWRSSYHHDGSQYDGWFIMGLGKEKGKQISYHLPISKWFDTGFAETIDRAPEWDGHTSADVLERLKLL